MLPQSEVKGLETWGELLVQVALQRLKGLEFDVCE